VEQELADLQGKADAVLAAMMEHKTQSLAAPDKDGRKTNKPVGLSGYTAPSRSESMATTVPPMRHVSIFSHASRNLQQVLADTSGKTAKKGRLLKDVDRTVRLLKHAESSSQCAMPAVVPEDVALVLELQCAPHAPGLGNSQDRYTV
jgi:hypothetical protein